MMLIELLADAREQLLDFFLFAGFATRESLQGLRK
jgi:hypothetical protein